MPRPQRHCRRQVLEHYPDVKVNYIGTDGKDHCFHE
jgi:hypothetical protein